MTPAALLSILIALFLLLLGLAAIWPFLRGSSNKATVEMLNDEIAARELITARLRTDLAQMEVKFNGKVEVLQDHFADTVAQRVIERQKSEGR